MKDLYAGMDRDNREAFRDLYCWRWIEIIIWLRGFPDHEDIVDDLFAMYVTGLLPDGKVPEDVEDIRIPKDSEIGRKADAYLEELLSEPNPVTQVAYDAEVYRKRDRAEEAVNATAGKRAKQVEMDRQARYWSRMTGWYSDIVCEGANRQALKDAGTGLVRWVTQKDEKVCSECRDLDGQVFPVDQVPDTHRNCRCYVVPVR